jgi:hypothetical protein
VQVAKRRKIFVFGGYDSKRNDLSDALYVDLGMPGFLTDLQVPALTFVRFAQKNLTLSRFRWLLGQCK